MLLNENIQEENPEGYRPKVHNSLGKVSCSKGSKIGYWTLVICTFGLYHALWAVPKQNNLKKMQIKINEAASGIDIQLEKRFDTLTKIVDAVKSQCEFERQTLESITAYRSGMTPVNNSSNNANLISSATNQSEIAHINQLNEKSNMIDRINQGVNLAFERYPYLSSNDSIRTLINESIMIEKEIAASRRLYNAQATEFNSIIYTFPTNVLLDNKNYEAIPLFVASQEKRKDIKIDF